MTVWTKAFVMKRKLIMISWARQRSRWWFNIRDMTDRAKIRGRIVPVFALNRTYSREERIYAWELFIGRLFITFMRRIDR